jgi:hypothetical protein
MSNSSDTMKHLEMNENIKMDRKDFQKLMFLNNALNDGWTIKKSAENYIFTKKHENKREIFQENYLENFIVSNFKN